MTTFTVKVAFAGSIKTFFCDADSKDQAFEKAREHLIKIRWFNASIREIEAST